MRIIDVYGKASGQQLNKTKFPVLFGSKVVASSKNDLKRSLGITREGGDVFGDAGEDLWLKDSSFLICPGNNEWKN